MRPEEQNRLMIWMGTLSGNPAVRAAALAEYGALAVRTVPTQL